MDADELRELTKQRDELLRTSLFGVTTDSRVRGLSVNDDYLPWVTSMETLPEGYRRSARLIADQLLEDRAGDFDYLFLPMLYMYRHALELQIKRVRRAAARYLGQGVPQERGEIGHNLGRAWKSLGELLAECGFPSHSPRLVAVGERIDEFEWLDGTGQRLRYPHELGDLAGRIISVPTIAAVMDEVIGYLDGIDTHLYESAQE